MDGKSFRGSSFSTHVEFIHAICVTFQSSAKLAVFEEGITRTVMCIIIRFIVCTTPSLALEILIIMNAPVMDTYEVRSSDQRSQ